MLCVICVHRYRFDGVTSMMYNHHGLSYTFTGDVMVLLICSPLAAVFCLHHSAIKSRLVASKWHVKQWYMWPFLWLLFLFQFLYLLFLIAWPLASHTTHPLVFNLCFRFEPFFVVSSLIPAGSYYGEWRPFNSSFCCPLVSL